MEEIDELHQIIQDAKTSNDSEKVKDLLKKLQNFIPPHPDAMVQLASLGNRSYFLTNEGIIVRFAPASEEGLPFLYIPTRHVNYDDIPPQILDNVKKNLNLLLKEIHDITTTWIRNIPNTNPMYTRVQKLIEYLENRDLY